MAETQSQVQTVFNKIADPSDQKVDYRSCESFFHSLGCMKFPFIDDEFDKSLKEDQLKELKQQRIKELEQIRIDLPTFEKYIQIFQQTQSNDIKIKETKLKEALLLFSIDDRLDMQKLIRGLKNEGKTVEEVQKMLQELEIKDEDQIGDVVSKLLYQ